MPLGETNIYAAWRIPKPKTRTKKALPQWGRGLGRGLRKTVQRQKQFRDPQHLSRLAKPVFTPLGETNIYAARRIPKPKTRTKKAPPPVGEGFGERVEKNRAAAKAISRPPASIPHSKASIYTAWRNQYLRRLMAALAFFIARHCGYRRSASFMQTFR